MKKNTFKNILDKRKIEIRNPSKHWTLKSKSCVYIAGETISWRIHEKTRFSKPVDLSSSIDNTNFPRFYKHTKYKISVLFVILHIIIKNVNENKILKCHTDCMHTTGIFVSCLVLYTSAYIERLPLHA